MPSRAFYFAAVLSVCHPKSRSNLPDGLALKLTQIKLTQMGEIPILPLSFRPMSALSKISECEKKIFKRR